MVQTIINEIVKQGVPVIVTCLMAVLTIVIKTIGSAIVEFIEEKRNAVIAKTNAEQYNSELAVAKNVWGIVEEFFRTNPAITKTIESAQAKFEEEILKKIPYLTDADIEHLRQVVAGEVNKGRDVIIAPAEEKKETETKVENTASTTEAKNDTATTTTETK